MDQREHEAQILRSFIGCLGEDSKLLGQPEPPEPDAHLAINGEDVGLELASYRQQGLENALEEANSYFKDAIHDSWVGDTSVNEVSVFLNYKELSVNGVPRRRNYEALITDLKALASDNSLVSDTDTEACFIPGERPDRQLPGGSDHRRSIVTSRYPRLED